MMWSQIWISRMSLEINRRPKLCKPSHEAHQTSSAKKYLPNLTAFKKSSRRWITGFIFNDFARNKCGSNYVGPLKKPNEQVRSKRTSQIWRPSKNPADTGSQVVFSIIYQKKNICCQNYACPYKTPDEQVRSKRISPVWRLAFIEPSKRSESSSFGAGGRGRSHSEIHIWYINNIAYL